MAIVMIGVSIYLMYFAFRYKKSSGVFATGMIVVMLVAGFTINPLQSGVDVIYDSDIIKAVQEINSQEDGIWITEDTGFQVPNYILMAGVKVLNSTNTYPDLEKWYLLDETKEYEDVYNRYAHIILHLNVQSDEKFSLIQADTFEVYLDIQDLQTLNIKYIFTNNELESLNTANITLEKIYDNFGYKIYKVQF